MKLEIKKNILENALNKAVRLTGKHLTLPVLSCILFEVKDDDCLIVKSTNLDLGFEIKLKAKIEDKGVLAVPGSILLNTLSSLKSENVVLESENGNLKIKSETKNSLIKCMPSEDFPSIPIINDSKVIKTDLESVIFGLKSVWYSASISNIKPELSSVFIHELEGLAFVATDSFRLAEKKINVKNLSEFPSILLPQKNVSDLIKILEEYKGEISLSFDKNQISFVIDDLYLVSRIVNGSFPDYKQIIPKSFTTEATLLKSDFANAVKSSSIFVDITNQIKIKVDSKNKNIEIISKNNDVGEYEEKIKANITGSDIELSFNAKYLFDCLQSISSESIIFNFGGIGKPLLIKGTSDNSFSYIVMPMNR